MSAIQTTTSLEADAIDDLAMVVQVGLPVEDLGGCGPVFNRLAIEVRRMIWGLLLINPELESTTLLQRDEAIDDGNEGLELHPAILRTSRQIYSEASEVLYGSNTFVFGIFRNKMGHSHILRGEYRECRFPREFDVEIVPSFKHIKHWKVTMNPRAYVGNFGPTRSFVNFCRAICDSNVKSLEVNMLRPEGSQDNVSYNCLVRALKPIEFLRNLVRLEVREVDRDMTNMTLYGIYTRDVGELGMPDATKQLVLIPEEQKVGFKLLAQGNSTVFQVFRAKEKLMVYAKAFERNEELRAAMEPKYHEALLRVDTTHWSFGKSLRDLIFKHPVEVALAKAIIASGRCDVNAFREARASVLIFLEPQYKHMAGAALAITKFFKPFKIKGRRFGADGNDTKDICIMAWDMVNYYANSLEREMPEATQAYLHEHPVEFQQIYGSLPREKFIRKMHKAKRHLSSLKGRKRFMRMVRNVLEDMDQQYLRIRNARLALFEHDPTDPECDIDLELCRSYEEFNMPIQEPYISPIASPDVELPQGHGIGRHRASTNTSTPSFNSTTSHERDTEGDNEGQVVKYTGGNFAEDHTSTDIGGNVKSSIKVEDTEGKDNTLADIGNNGAGQVIKYTGGSLAEGNTSTDIGGGVKPYFKVDDTESKANTGTDIGSDAKSSIKVEDSESKANKDNAISMLISPPRNRPIVPIFKKYKPTPL